VNTFTCSFSDRDERQHKTDFTESIVSGKQEPSNAHVQEQRAKRYAKKWGALNAGGNIERTG